MEKTEIERKNKMIKKIIVSSICLLCLTGCGFSSQKGQAKLYEQIRTDEAIEWFQNNENYKIVDVRTQEEYEEGHIPEAICIPNETIGTKEIEQLPDKKQMIFIYCRSGVRSKQAAEKLANMGYENIVEFGGILDWTGEIVRE